MSRTAPRPHLGDDGDEDENLDEDDAVDDVEGVDEDDGDEVSTTFTLPTRWMGRGWESRRWSA